MRRTAFELRADAERIWWAGVAAVAPERLIRSHVHVDDRAIVVDEDVIDLARVERIAIVGAGKAAGAMAAALESVLGPKLLAEKKACGWINVPADCIVPTQCVVLHASRPAGVNEPRPEGVAGTQRILQLVGSLGPNDVCFCLLTGGGSALLPAPVPEISLDDKVRVTRILSAAGANIQQLNTVRRHISLVKGGGLARACSAGRLVVLVISDVLGDPLELIASGPTVLGTTMPRDALAVLESLSLTDEPTAEPVVRYLTAQASATPDSRLARVRASQERNVTHHILGNNAVAVDAAGIEAERLGYTHAMISATAPEGPAEDVGRHLAHLARDMQDRGSEAPSALGGGPGTGHPRINCLISGGEPTVSLVDESRRGKGGRNQQLALAALAELHNWDGIALLSAGTDGEDGPTDAAGTVVTQDVVDAAQAAELDPLEFVARNDAYSFFQQAGGLFITGATQTNVCDLRIVLASD